MLSQQLFGDPGSRQSKDIDLLIRPEDLVRADRILAEAGYRCIFPGFELTASQMNYLGTGVHHFEYIHGERKINVELHWRSYLWTSQQADCVWHRCRQIDWMGVAAACLDDDNQLLYLCDHGAAHKWFRIKWLSDMAMMLAQDRPDGWDSLLAMADRLGLRRALAQSALLVHWLYDIPLPAQLCRLIKEEKTSVALGSAALTGLHNHDASGGRFEGVRHAFYLMRLKPSQPYGMLLKGMLICPADFTIVPLPDSLFWLYIPLRPVFWLWRNYLKRSPAKTDR
jgi:hypothetical protein